MSVVIAYWLAVSGLHLMSATYRRGWSGFVGALGMAGVLMGPALIVGALVIALTGECINDCANLGVT